MMRDDILKNEFTINFLATRNTCFIIPHFPPSLCSFINIVQEDVCIDIDDC
jgi:hypothetical protein